MFCRRRTKPQAAQAELQKIHRLTVTKSNQTLSKFPEGSLVSVRIPAGHPKGAVFGVRVYSDQSCVWTAAVHAGAIDAAKGGSVYVQVFPGQAQHAAAVQHGITSQPGSASTCSFCFVAHKVGDPVPTRVDRECLPARQANFSPTAMNHIYVVKCPPGAPPGSIYGFGVYTGDSCVWTAAVHAGVIDATAGGTAYVQATGSMTSYATTRRNGITSCAYGPWDNSFVFVRLNLVASKKRAFTEADCDENENEGRTALMMASANGHVSLVRFLLSRRADVDATDKHGRTALLLAMENEHHELAQVLVKAGADVTVPDQHGFTPLMTCALRGHTPLAEAILDACPKQLDVALRLPVANTDPNTDMDDSGVMVDAEEE